MYFIIFRLLFTKEITFSLFLNVLLALKVQLITVVLILISVKKGPINKGYKIKERRKENLTLSYL